MTAIGDLKLRLRWGSEVNQREIVHLKQRHQPDFRFEWHPSEKRLYCIDLRAAAKAGLSCGNLIGTDLETQGAAYNAMLVWCRGYNAGKSEISHNDQGQLILLGGK